MLYTLRKFATVLVVLALLAAAIYGTGTAGADHYRRERARCASIAEAFENAISTGDAQRASQWATTAAQVSCSNFITRN